MSKLNEVIDSLNNENVDEIKETLTSEASTLQKENSRLYNRAKKAEGFEKSKEGKWIKKEVVKEIKSEKTDKPGELGYAEKAFLNSNGIKGSEEIKLAKEYLDTGKYTLDEIIENKYFNNDLKDMRDDKAAKEASPQGGGRSGGGSVKENVQYWLDKKEMPPESNPKLRQEYVNKRYEMEKNNTPFSK